LTPAANSPTTDETFQTYDSLFAQYGEKYRWLVMGGVGLGVFANLMASTSINVAIPAIMGTFGIGQDTAQWLSTGFLASATVGMLMAAWSIKRFGIRYTFLGAMLMFIASSLAGAISNSTELLIATRVFQGSASGFLLPLATVLISNVFPPNKQGMGMGIFGILAVMGPAMGPYLGGLVVDTFSWRAVFYLALPMAIISVPLGLELLPGHKLTEQERKESANFDWLGLVLLSACISLTLVAISNGQREGWSSDATLIKLLLGTLSGITFVWHQYRVASPLLDMRLFQYKLFRQGALISFMYGAFLFSTMYTVPLFLQAVQDVSATSAGFAMLPGGLMMVVFFPISGALSDKYPPHYFIGIGLLLFAYSTLVMVDANKQTDLTTIIWWIVIGRIGMAFIMPPLNMVAIGHVPKELSHQASGAVNFFRQLGGAIGVNLISVYLERQSYFHLDYLTSTQHQGNSSSMEFVGKILPDIQQAGIEASQQTSIAAWVLGKELYRQGLTGGFQDSFGITAILTIIALIPTYFVGKHLKETLIKS